MWSQALLFLQHLYLLLFRVPDWHHWLFVCPSDHPSLAFLVLEVATDSSCLIPLPLPLASSDESISHLLRNKLVELFDSLFQVEDWGIGVNWLGFCWWGVVMRWSLRQSLHALWIQIQLMLSPYLLQRFDHVELSVVCFDRAYLVKQFNAQFNMVAEALHLVEMLGMTDTILLPRSCSQEASCTWSLTCCWAV